MAAQWLNNSGNVTPSANKHYSVQAARAAKRGCGWRRIIET